MPYEAPPVARPGVLFFSARRPCWLPSPGRRNVSVRFASVAEPSKPYPSSTRFHHAQHRPRTSLPPPPVPVSAENHPPESAQQTGFQQPEDLLKTHFRQRNRQSWETLESREGGFFTLFERVRSSWMGTSVQIFGRWSFLLVILFLLFPLLPFFHP